MNNNICYNSDHLTRLLADKRFDLSEDITIPVVICRGEQHRTI